MRTFNFGLSALVLAVPLLAIIGLVALVRAAVGASASHSAEDAMERPHRFAQLYGYAVCLITVIFFLTAASSFVESLINATDPLHAIEREYGDPRLPASFEVYRAEYRDPALQAMTTRDRTPAVGPGASQPPEPARTLSDAELRQVYDAKRRELLDAQRFRTRRSLLTSAFGMLLAAALFAAHWRWLRRLPAGERPAPRV